MNRKNPIEDEKINPEGAAFETNEALLPEEPKKELIGSIIKIFGILILFFGTLVNIMISTTGGRYPELAFLIFVISELGVILFSVLLLGLAKVIQLLYSINHKMK